MPIILGALAVLAAIYFFIIRARNTVEMADEVADMAQTVLGAARRFGFRRKANVHPVDSIEDPNLAIGGLATAYLEQDGFPSEEAKRGLILGLQSALGVSLKDAEEIAVLGHWFVNECKGADPAVSRLARKLFRMEGAEGLVKAMDVIAQITRARGGTPSEKQSEALAEIKRIFRV